MVVPAMDNLPRVPDAHGDIVDEKLYSDLYIRTSWIDASVALNQIEKGKARGRRSAVYMRSLFQSHLYSLGCSIQKHAGKVLFVAILVLSTFCVGLKSATIHSKVHQLWIQEGGRLEKELKYTQHTLGETDSSTHQLLIQTPKELEGSLLHPQALLAHLDVVKMAISVEVHMFDTTWSLKDVCHSPSIPNFDAHYIEQIFENIIPCAIITPLDCFWEGSKLSGPDYPVHIPILSRSDFNNRVQWTSLNPQHALEIIKSLNYQFPFDTLEHYMKRAGITTGYTEKPCLNPKDPLCPVTAPNHKSQQPPDIGAELTGGCYGFAAKYMHWPEELVVGGVTRNRTRHLKKAKALQTVVQLMGERELYEFWEDHYKVHHVGWTQEKASQVLIAWQKKFSAEVNKIMKAGYVNSYEMFAFSSAALDDILGKYTHPSPMSLALGTAATLVYAAITLLRWREPVNGQSGVGIAGVLLIGISTAAGLGFCALLGIAFNAATTQVVPFLALGLGVDHIFILTHAYGEQQTNEQTGLVLKKSGLSVLFSAASTVGSFFAAVLIPVPALRMFCLQAAILLSFNLAAVLLVFPAMVSLDLRRRQSGRSDILCCCLPTLMQPNSNVQCQYSRSLHHQLPMQEDTSCAERDCLSFSLSRFALNYYGPFITTSCIKVLGMLALAGILGFSLFTAMKLPDGLELTDLVPQGTDEYKFLNAQGKLFGFYNMFAVTQNDFEYPTNQKLLHEYHEAFVRVPHVIKNDDGGLSGFWLSLFRDWLVNLQKAFDRDYQNGCITQERWFPNASEDAILAYKLLVQTGHVDNPVDKSLVTHVRLVDNDGIINPKAFYNYLSAWASNDRFAYGFSQGNLRPEPREWYHVPNDYELKIAKSAPLIYTQIPYNLYGLSDTTEIKILIAQVREICERFEGRGLPNYPSGIPFIFWEQYMNLRPCLALALGCAIAAAFVLVGILLLSVWASILVVFSVVTILIQLLGVMTLLGIKLSAIPAVILVLSVGLGVCFTVHISLGFITSIGSRNRRVKLALEHALGPVIHGVLTSILAVLMLSTSPFEFIVRHFFWLLLSVMVIGAVNGLFFFPILLSIVGPEAEVVPLNNPNRISTPSPPPQRKTRRNNNSSVNKPYYTSSNNKKSSYSRQCSKSSHQSTKHQPQNEPSLTTITEEPQSWQSSSMSSIHDKHESNNSPERQSIFVQPEVTVETHHGGDHQNTKVTATANIKVELIAPGRARAYHTTTTTNS